MLTVFIFFRTSNINKKLKELKTNKKYNEKRMRFSETLLQFAKAIAIDDADIKKNKGNILYELNILKGNFHTEFDVIQNLNIFLLIIHLEKRNNHNRNIICNLLTRVASYLDEKKEEIT